MFERFTKSARTVVIEAKMEAIRLRHRYVGTEHLLLALINEDADGVAARVLRDAGLTPQRVRDDVDRIIDSPGGAGHSPGADSERVLDEEDAAALKAIGIDLDAVRASVEETFGEGALRPPVEMPTRRGLFGRRDSSRVNGPVFSARGKKALELSLREAIHLKHSYIGPEHILLGLIREGEGLAAFVLTAAGLDLEDLRGRVLEALKTAA